MKIAKYEDEDNNQIEAFVNEHGELFVSLDEGKYICLTKEDAIDFANYIFKVMENE